MRIGRVFAVASLAVSTLQTFTAAPVVNAAVAPPPELIAHTMTTQTSGPSGSWASPNNLIPWGLDRIDSRGPGPVGNPYGEVRLDGTYTYSSDGTGVKVYVLDSGVDGSHVDNFGSRVVDGWSYRADSTSLSSYKSNRAAYDADLAAGVPEADRRGIPPCSATYTVGSTTYDRQFDPATFDAPNSIDSTDKGKSDNDGHGTHVAGIAAGALTGLAKNPTVVPVRALDSCGMGSATMVLAGLNWIKADHPAGGKAVVNMSIGFDGSATSIDTAIRSLMAEGIVVVAAAGNDGQPVCTRDSAGNITGYSTPAGTPGTISVGATTSSDTEAYYSSYGDCVDIFSPGTSVLSSWPYSKPAGGSASTHTWWVQSGTSMAAPHVTGAVARWLQSQALTASAGTEVSSNAFAWLRLNATCDPIVPYSSSRTQQTPNRLLAVGAAVKKPCGPQTVTVTTSAQAATVSFEAATAFNGADITAYHVSLTPGVHTCDVDPSVATEPYSCSFSGLERATTYTASVTATNSAGTGPARTKSATTPDVPPAVTGLSATSGDHQASFTWGGAVVGATYTVTMVPGGATCSSTTTGCTVTGLVNGQSYSASVVGVNPNGTGSSSASVSVTPDGSPEVPALKTAVADRSVTLRWLAVADFASVTYVVTASPGGQSCTTTSTSCTITGLSNGAAYSFAITIRTGTGKVAASSTATTARPGFTVKKTSVKKGSRTLLTSIVVPVSKGKRTWSAKGGCFISAGRMVAPKRRVTCSLTLATARTSTFPAARTTVRVAVR